MKIGNTKCQNKACGAWCQGFKAPDGKILCADCLWKIWGMKPYE